uniref:WAT1-related protein n=1 Tax=Salix viminalis TaxID=40686 RepID=A0A6N2KZ43_SALVM
MEAGGRVKKCFVSSQAVMSMGMVQVMATGMQLLSKIILNDGKFVLALMTYSCGCRGIKSKMNWSVFFWLFVNSLSGILLAMGLFYYGLKYTTATYAVNFLNLVPIVTFVFSVIFRLEKLGLRTRAGKIKISGAILCVLRSYDSLSLQGKNIPPYSCSSAIASLILYGIYCRPNCSRCSHSNIIQSAVIGLCMDRSSAAGKLEWNLQLLTIIYSGSLASAATFCLISWAVVRRGPSYPPVLNPLTLIFVAVLEALILGAEITVGTLLGMVLMIIIGLNSLLGKTNEMTNMPKSSIEALLRDSALKIVHA